MVYRISSRHVAETTTPFGPLHDGLGPSPRDHGVHQHEVDGRLVRPEGGAGPGPVGEDADHLAEEEDRRQREGQDFILANFYDLWYQKVIFFCGDA